MNSEIISICGNSNYLPDFEAIGNDPNFVFVNDPTYLTVKLFDTEGSVINVNSWIEFANYVNNGWSNNITPLFNYERSLFFILFLSTALLIFLLGTEKTTSGTVLLILYITKGNAFTDLPLVNKLFTAFLSNKIYVLLSIIKW